jgi:hypothetical protein
MNVPSLISAIDDFTTASAARLSAKLTETSLPSLARTTGLDPSRLTTEPRTRIGAPCAWAGAQTSAIGRRRARQKRAPDVRECAKAQSLAPPMFCCVQALAVVELNRNTDASEVFRKQCTVLRDKENKGECGLQAGKWRGHERAALTDPCVRPSRSCPQTVEAAREADRAAVWGRGCGWKALADRRSHHWQLRNASTADTQMEPRGLERFTGGQLGFDCAWRVCRAQGTPDWNTPLHREF